MSSSSGDIENYVLEQVASVLEENKYYSFTNKMTLVLFGSYVPILIRGIRPIQNLLQASTIILTIYVALIMFVTLYCILANSYFRKRIAKLVMKYRPLTIADYYTLQAKVYKRTEKNSATIQFLTGFLISILIILADWFYSNM